MPMSRAMRLYQTRTIQELAGMLEGIKPIPKEKRKPGSIHIYTTKDRRLSDDIARAIQWHMDDRAKATPEGGGR